MKKVRILSVLLIIAMLINLIPKFSNADDKVTYKVKQITSETQINKNNATDYIIVLDNDSVTCALKSEIEPSKTFMKTYNAHHIEINDANNEITSDVEFCILWNFADNAKTLDSELENPFVLSTSNQLFFNGNYKKRQMQFCKYGNGRNGATPSGIDYSDNANPMTLEFNEDGTCKIFQHGNTGTTNVALGYYTDESRITGTEEQYAESFKIYEVIKSYQKQDKFTTNDVKTEVNIAKTVECDENYENNGIVDLVFKTSSTNKVQKDIDVVIAVDKSQFTRSEVTLGEGIFPRYDALNYLAIDLASHILGMNERNRVGIVQFGDNVLNEDDTYELGLTNNLEDIIDLLYETEAPDGTVSDFAKPLSVANKLLEKESLGSGHDSLVILLSDVVPNVWNKTYHTIFNNMTDAQDGESAINYLQYALKTPLYELELMKDAGIEFYAINTQSDTVGLSKSSGYLVSKEDNSLLLKTLTNGNSVDIDLVEYAEYILSLEDSMVLSLESGANILDDGEDEENYNEIAKHMSDILNFPAVEKLTGGFRYTDPEDSVVKIGLRDDFLVQRKTIGQAVPVVRVYKDDEVIEEVTFDENGAAYSNALSLRDADSENIDTKYFDYDVKNNEISWKIDNLYSNENTLEFQVYLLNTADLYGDGTHRQPGIYDITKYDTLYFTNLKGEVEQKEYIKASVPWKTEDTDVLYDEFEETGDVVKTGDTIILSVVALCITLGITVYIIITKKRD